MEIQKELQEQGVVEVHRVTVKETEKVPTNTLFLTFNTPDLPKEIMGGYLKVKVALFVPNLVPNVLLQLQQVRPHESTLQGCCKVSSLWKR